eukprot:7134255-Alexandrium_andersonii.AAC.1
MHERGHAGGAREITQARARAQRHLEGGRTGTLAPAIARARMCGHGLCAGPTNAARMLCAA